MNKPYAESCDQNRDVILGVIRRLFTAPASVLEIASGTGQHAVYFAGQLPHLNWLTSDLETNHAGIAMWIEEAGLANVRPPLLLDTRDSVWPVDRADHVFSANALHIMDDAAVTGLFSGLGRILDAGALFACYGPFNYAGEYTSDSNRRFDQWLKDRDPASGIKDMAWLNILAQGAGLEHVEDFEMPANNRIQVWRRTF